MPIIQGAIYEGTARAGNISLRWSLRFRVVSKPPVETGGYKDVAPDGAKFDLALGAAHRPFASPRNSWTVSQIEASAKASLDRVSLRSRA